MLLGTDISLQFRKKCLVIYKVFLLSKIWRKNIGTSLGQSLCSLHSPSILVVQNPSSQLNSGPQSLGFLHCPKETQSWSWHLWPGGQCSSILQYGIMHLSLMHSPSPFKISLHCWWLSHLMSFPFLHWLCWSKPPMVMAGRRPAMTTGWPKADPGWLFKKMKMGMIGNE